MVCDFIDHIMIHSDDKLLAAEEQINERFTETVYEERY
jgi:hypothetical protein